jgi:hypothetical protein
MMPRDEDALGAPAGPRACGLRVDGTARPTPSTRVRGFAREEAPAGVALTFECELGYTFDPAVWGQGFATEAARCVRDYARDVLRWSYAVSAILPQNVRSRRVSERGGASFDGQWTWSVSRGIATCGRSRQGNRASRGTR